MKTLPDEFGVHARLVESMDFPHFLDLTYESNFGEVWLYNNDLEILLSDETFRLLYQERIFGRLAEKIDCVKIIVAQEFENMIFGESLDSKVEAQLRKLCGSSKDGSRLNRLLFAKMPEEVPPSLKEANGDTWIFYTHRGQLDRNAGIAMVRHRRFPFENGGGRVAVVWQLRDQHLLQAHLRAAFQSAFQNDSNFSWFDIDPDLHPIRFIRKGASSELVSSLRESRARQYVDDFISIGDSVDVAILTAIDAEERAVHEVFEGVKPTPYGIDEYHYAIVDGRRGRRRSVLIAQLCDMGGASASVWTWDIIERWKPKFVILVGVAGGNPANGDIKLGDLVVGNPVVGYDRSRLKEEGEAPRFRTHDAGTQLLRVISKAKRKWSCPPELRRPDKGDVEVTIHDAFAIASGYKLMATRDGFAEIKRIHDEVQAIEMEAYGAAYACEHHPSHKPEFVVVKGIMDKSDPESREDKLKDAWKDYAAKVSASFVREIIENI